jgi:hypothetical protein
VSAATSNLSHQGERIYTGDFPLTLKTALPSAVGAPEGQRMHIKGWRTSSRSSEHLVVLAPRKQNPACLLWVISGHW